MAKKLLTRREIIDIWQAQRDEFLDLLCCPFCRDILYKDDKGYYCPNQMCKCEYEDVN